MAFATDMASDSYQKRPVAAPVDCDVPLKVQQCTATSHRATNSADRLNKTAVLPSCPVAHGLCEARTVEWQATLVTLPFKGRRSKG